jgi:hypothetical protein
MLLLTLTVACLASTACSSRGGALAIRSELERDIVLAGDFTTGVYSIDDRNQVDVVLVEGPMDAPTQAIHIRMYWMPRAGRTPLDLSATNAVVRYVVFAGDATGVYSGSGFLFPDAKPGKADFSGVLRDTALRLADATPNFADRLGLARATGEFTVSLDEAATHQLLRQIEVTLTERLGYPRFVLAQ